MTRKLFVVAQDVIISEDDCGTKESIIIKKQSASGIEIPLSKNIRGRVLAENVESSDGKVMFKKGHLLSKGEAQAIEAAGITAVHVRSPLSCKTVRGVCAQCYGLDLGKNEMIALGEAIGTVAAQAIGEPGTQLTMRTFHSGGAASAAGDITAGLPRVEEIFEKRSPRNPAVVATVDGVVSEIKDLTKEKVIVVIPDVEHIVPKKSKSKKKLTEEGKTEAIEYPFHYRRTPFVKVGDKVKKGELLTDGSADISDIFENAGADRAKEYVISEVGKIYELQGETVSRKHIEVIVKQMFSRKRVEDAGDTNLADGMVVDDTQLADENRKIKAQGGTPATALPIVLGITEVSLSRKSFLSAASFQHTTRVLIGNAVRGAEDDLQGLMENVIIGRLIPAGTGYPGSPKADMIEKVRPRETIIQ